MGTVEEQEAIFASRHISQLQAWVIKQQLTNEKVTMRSPLARFVGPDAYEAAGGALRRDLFSDDVAFDDRALLERLAKEKLDAVADELRAKGWGWTIATVERDHPDEVTAMRRARPTIEDRTAEEKERLAAVTKRIEELEEDENLECGEEYDALYDEREELSCPRTYYTQDQMAKAGVVLTLGYDGEIRIDEGFVRPEDAADDERRANEGGSREKGERSKKGGPAYNGALSQDIKATNGHALGAALLDRPDVGLRYMMFVAARDALRSCFYWASGTTLTAKASNTEPDANDLSIMQTARTIEEKMAGIPLSCFDLPIEAGWEAFLSFTDEEVAQVASAVARATMLRFSPQTRELPALVGRSIGADIRQHWRPTAKNFLGRIRKDQILAITQGFVAEDAQLELGKMKKKDLAKAAEEIFAGTTKLEVTDWERVHAWKPEGGLGEDLPEPAAQPAAEPDDDEEDELEGTKPRDMDDAA
jgi:ParB family chromosome partitioning protein